MKTVIHSLFFVFAVAVSVPTAKAQVLGPDFVNFYTVDNLFSVPGLPVPLGGIAFKDGDPNTLLVVGGAGKSTANIYEISVTRDANGHVNGYSGTAQFHAMVPEADGGLIYGPGGVLLYTTYPTNLVGMIKPGSTIADKIVPLTPLGVGPSTGGIAVTPAGFQNPGRLKLTSYGVDSWYDAELVPDGAGTFDVMNVGPPVFIPVGPGPESIEHVDKTYPGFTVQSALIMEWFTESVGAYDLDAAGDIVPASRRDFLQCCGLFFLGSATDSQTGDFLVATYGSGDEIFVVKRNQTNLGTNYCGPANINSTGQSAAISAYGNISAAMNDLTLTASLLPQSQFAYFLNSDTQGFIPFPPGSSGNLCLSGGIGRHVKQVGNTGTAGELIIPVDLTNLPRPSGGHAVVAGETWNFQCWFRDKVGGVPTSNFTDGIEILFQ